MGSPVIEIYDLTKFYGKTRGIEKINLTIGDSEIFGFIGPNGAGKSTTIRLLLNLIFPTNGNARIMGLDVIRDSRKIKQRIGYIPSEAGTYGSMTVNEFLDYSGRFYNLSDIEARKTRMAGMFELDLKRKVEDLSTGNRRKVAIIQSLLHEPSLLILDEPTTGLDPLMQARFFDLLREENRRGMTIFYSSHVLSEIQMLCGRVAIIRDGRIIKEEEIDTLRRKQLKKIGLEFDGKPDERILSLPGIINLSKGADHSVSFLYSGDINDLVRMMAGIRILNLTIEEPPLEEIFLHYYNMNGK
jgi:ABC-2 type transport system ATP-binding protein